MFALFWTDHVGRQVSLAKPPSGQTQFAYEAGIEDDQDHERTEKHEEAVKNVLVDDVVDEIALEVGLNGARWLRYGHVRYGRTRH